MPFSEGNTISSQITYVSFGITFQTFKLNKMKKTLILFSVLMLSATISFAAGDKKKFHPLVIVEGKCTTVVNSVFQCPIKPGQTEQTRDIIVTSVTTTVHDCDTGEVLSTSSKPTGMTCDMKPKTTVILTELP